MHFPIPHTQSPHVQWMCLPFRIAFRNLLKRGSRFLFLLVLLAFSSLVILSIASLFDTLVFNLCLLYTSPSPRDS